MKQDEFNAKVLGAINNLNAHLRKQMAREHCLRALAFAVLEQPGLNRTKLAEDYEALILSIQAQTPPHHQDATTYEAFSMELTSRLQGPPAPAR